MFNAKNLLQVGIYHTGCEFGDMADFMNYVSDYFIYEPYTIEGLQKGVSKILSKSFTQEAVDENDLCVRILIQADVKRASNYYNDKNTFANAIDHADVASKLEEFNNLAFVHFSDLSINFEKPEIFIVDNFPYPHEDKAHLAITYSKSDEEEFGTKKGIYFLKSFLRPYYSVYLLLHEYIHVVMDKNDEPLMGGPLEEGIAEVYGLIILSSSLLGRQFTETIFFYHRLFTRQVKHLDVYLDYSRMAYSLYNFIGLDGMRGILRGSRSQLKDLESKLWRGTDLDTLDFSSAREHLHLMNKLLLINSKLYFCSPVAKYLSRHIKVGVTVKHLSEITNLSVATVKEGLAELEEYPRFIEMGITGDYVKYSDCDRIVTPNALRYRIEK
jgi:hypothetical protein